MTRAQAATYIVGVVMSVDPTTLGLNNQPNPTNPGGVSDLQLFQNQQSAAYNRTLVSGNFANQSANASNLNYPVAGPATDAGYIGAQNAETGVTFVSSTVVTAQGQISVAAAANDPALITGQAVPTDNINMTTNIETIPAFGTLAINQTVTGLVTDTLAASTYQSGDVINGGGVAANNTVTITASSTVATNTAASVNNVKNFAVRNVSGGAGDVQTFNNALWTGVQNFTVTSAVAGAQTDVVNGSAATVYGNSAGVADGMNVAFAGGSTNQAFKVNLAGAGQLGAVSVIDYNGGAADINTITVSSSGTNYANLAGTTNVKTVTVTGSGNNNISLTAAGALSTTSAVTIDASAATGDNVIDLGVNVSSAGVTVKGSTGASLTTLGLVIPAAGTLPTITDIDGLQIDLGSNGTLIWSSP